jgi:hypothetical protein
MSAITLLPSPCCFSSPTRSANTWFATRANVARWPEAVARVASSTVVWRTIASISRVEDIPKEYGVLPRAGSEQKGTPSPQRVFSTTRSTRARAIVEAAMKHAGPEALSGIEKLLAKVRKNEVLTERKLGAFYLKSSGFLHFHEDPEGMFADLKIAGTFRRLRVSTRAEQAAFLREVAATLGATRTRRA